MFVITVGISAYKDIAFLGDEHKMFVITVGISACVLQNSGRYWRQVNWTLKLKDLTPSYSDNISFEQPCTGSNYHSQLTTLIWLLI
jgi:hypothetical protein